MAFFAFLMVFFAFLMTFFAFFTFLFAMSTSSILCLKLPLGITYKSISPLLHLLKQFRQPSLKMSALNQKPYMNFRPKKGLACRSKADMFVESG